MNKEQRVKPPEKRPYEPPRILYREPLEAMAAVCAPVPPAKGNVGFCSQGPISS
ncbi:MAG TPA: hypothetical protein VH394_13590 [Thermoanaerobaculia bacterium]|nr:hypothetical protein [Thermoanaerobaculia bacterium]